MTKSPDPHRAGVARLAAALGPVVMRRGKKDLREWGGPSAGTVRDVMDGTWQTSPQSRATFEKLDAAGEWPAGTAWGLYHGDDAVIATLTPDGAVPRRVLDMAAVVGGGGQAEPGVHGGHRGKGLMSEERVEIVAALVSVGQQLLDLAQRIERAGDQPTER
jgi:hypothetical protein